MKYRQITGKSSRFLYTKHIFLTVVFVVIPDVDQNGLSNVPDHKPENKVLMTWVKKVANNFVLAEYMTPIESTF